MTAMNLRFAFKKETKGVVRFQEVGEDGKPALADSCLSTGYPHGRVEGLPELSGTSVLSIHHLF